MSGLIVSTASGSCTNTSFALFRLGLPASSSPWVADTLVHRFDVSASDPEAVLELTFGRVEVISQVSGGSTGAHLLRGQDIDFTRLSSLGASSSSSAMWQEVGRYYFTGSLHLRFDEPFENLRRPNNSHQHAPAFQVKRVDSSTGVDLHADVWFEEHLS